MQFIQYITTLFNVILHTPHHYIYKTSIIWNPRYTSIYITTSLFHISFTLYKFLMFGVYKFSCLFAIHTVHITTLFNVILQTPHHYIYKTSIIWNPRYTSIYNSASLFHISLIVYIFLMFGVYKFSRLLFFIWYTSPLYKI